MARIRCPVCRASCEDLVDDLARGGEDVVDGLVAEISREVVARAAGKDDDGATVGFGSGGHAADALAEGSVAAHDGDDVDRDQVGVANQRLAVFGAFGEELDEVDAVDLRTSGDLTITIGEEESLTITASAVAISALTSDVDECTLVLDYGGGAFGVSRISYALTVRSLDRVQVSGSGSVSGADVLGPEGVVEITDSGSLALTDTHTQDLTVRIDGSGSVTLDGSSVSLDLTMDGSGDFSGEDLRTQKASASIAGSGSAWMFVTDTLRASVSGSGGLTYAGDPVQVATDVTGSGTVEIAAPR